MREKLSALIPCKNEENNIRACLESVRRLADEIVVADSGSTDGTLDIVRRIGGCRVICREYCNPASFKNWAIPQCTHPWVLILDADERVTEQLAEEIRRALGGPSPDVDAFTIPFLSYFLGHPVRHAGITGQLPGSSVASSAGIKTGVCMRVLSSSRAAWGGSCRRCCTSASTRTIKSKKSSAATPRLEPWNCATRENMRGSAASSSVPSSASSTCICCGLASSTGSRGFRSA